MNSYISSRLFILIFAVFIFFTGCSDENQYSPNNNSSSQPVKQKRIYVIKNFTQYADSINAQIKRGIEEYAKRYGNVRVEFSQKVSSVEEAHSVLLNFLKQEADGIIVSDPAYIDLIDNSSKEFSKVRFAFIDSEKTKINAQSNLFNYNFSNQQIGFFMGLVAGKLFPESRVLFLGAQKDKRTEDLLKGIGNGLGYEYNKTDYFVEYLGNTVDAYQNIDYAYAIANRYYLNAYPLILQGVGNASKGIFSAAVKNQQYVIGYGVDQTAEVGEFEKKIFITSIIKRYDSAAYEAMKDLNSESVSENNVVLGCRSNSIDYVLDNPNDRITLIKDLLNEYKEKIKKGTITFQETK